MLNPFFAVVEEYLFDNAPPSSAQHQDMTVTGSRPFEYGGVMFAQGYPTGQQMDDIGGLDGYGCDPFQVGVRGGDLFIDGLARPGFIVIKPFPTRSS